MVKRRVLLGIGVGVVSGILGCKPEFADVDAIITAPRVVAIRATPAEAAPSTPVSFDALFVAPDGTGDLDDLSWAYCVARKPLTDEGTVAPACLGLTGESLVQLGAGQGVKKALPVEACQLFGPDIPPPMAGQPSGRPTDPDPSGGYYQPIRLLTPNESSAASIGTARLVCGLSGSTPEQSIEFNERYRANVNPEVASLRVSSGGRTVEIAPDTGGDAGAKIHANEVVKLEVGWPGCSSGRDCGDGICDIDEDAMHCPKDCTVPRGCSGAERYLAFDPESHALVERREAIRISWFATAGTFESDRTDRAAGELEHASSNTWTAPNGTGEVRLWVVLRDDRGGAGWQAYRVAVSE